MFVIDRFIEMCRGALAAANADKVVQDLVAEAVSDPGSVAAAVREPEHAGFEVLHRAADLTVLNFAWAGAFGPAVFTGLALVGAGEGEVMLAWALPLSVVAALCFLRLPARATPAADEPGLAPA